MRRGACSAPLFTHRVARKCFLIVDTIKNQMGSKIKLKAGDGPEFGAYASEPTTASHSAIVVIQEIFGVNSHIRSIVDDYAGQGFFAIAPALFDRVQPDLELLRQIRLLRFCVLALFASTALLFANCFYPIFPKQKFRIIEAERLNIREKGGVLKAALSNSANFNEFKRAERGGVTFSGLMFYNEEGQEEGGLVYSGKALPGGQDADVSLTMDQFRQDQNVYLHHEEHKDAQNHRIEDGLSIMRAPIGQMSKNSKESTRNWKNSPPHNKSNFG
jgi:Dienelactone hydrolase family